MAKERLDIIVSQNLQRIAAMVDHELDKLHHGERLAFTLFVWTKPESVFVGNQNDNEALAAGILEIAAKINRGDPIVATHERH